MAKYGTTEEDLALVKVLMSEYGSKNPDARFKRPIPWKRSWLGLCL
jgi:acetyl-CoA acetyltransferase